MLTTIQLPRIFKFEDKGNKIELPDPDPKWSADTVVNFYANTYPILTTAKISGPLINNDQIEYKMESVIGTKG